MAILYGVLTGLGKGAFYKCTNLTSITIPDSVTSLGACAFYDCDKLETITFGDDSQLACIDSSLFWGCDSLANITIPNSVLSIKDQAFYNCASLSTLTIPDNVTSIDSGAFGNCTSLQNVVIPDSVTSIGSGAFGNCTSMQSITLPFVGATKDGSENTNFGYIFGGNLSVPESLTTVVITGGTSIGEWVFENCNSLTSVTIPDSVVSIDDGAFFGCSSLTGITIPESVTSIGASAFFDCSSITSVTIPSSVISIGFSAFYGCDSLQSITLPFVGATPDETENTYFGYIFGSYDDLYVIPNDYYLYAIPNSLSKVVLTDITTIFKYSFRGCSSIESITIPDSVTSIEYNAFYNCQNLVEVINYSSLDIVAGTKSNGYVAYYAKKVINSDEESRFLVSGDYTFYNDNGTYYLVSYNGNDTNLVLPSDINGHEYSINSGAFYCNYKITSVYIPSSVTSIGDYAFSHSSNLTTVTFDDNSQLTSIGEQAFYYCTSLTTVTFGDSSQLTNIGDYAFYYCTGLTTVTLGNNSQLTTIGDNAFWNCYRLTSITIPKNVTSIGGSAFSSCRKLVQVYNYSKLNIVAGESFSIGSLGVYAKQVITPSDESRFITSGDYTFYNDFGTYYLVYYTGNETNLVLPNDINGHKYQINRYAFYGNDNITSVILSNGVKSIGVEAFYGCSSLRRITISESVESIGREAFLGCRILEIVDNSKLNIVAGSTDNGHVAYYAKKISTSEEESKFITVGDYLFYNDNGSYSLMKYNGNDTHLTLPSDIYGNSYSIAGAFCNNKQIISVVIPEGVTSIGFIAFSGCSNLVSIALPQNIIIARSTFNGCLSLTIVYYGGTSEQWEDINDPVLNNVPYRYYYSENQPTTDGNYWHYVDGVPTKWL